MHAMRAVRRKQIRVNSQTLPSIKNSPVKHANSFLYSINQSFTLNIQLGYIEAYK